LRAQFLAIEDGRVDAGFLTIELAAARTINQVVDQIMGRCADRVFGIRPLAGELFPKIEISDPGLHAQLLPLRGGDLSRHQLGHNTKGSTLYSPLRRTTG